MTENAHKILDINIDELLFISDDEVDHRYKEKIKNAPDAQTKTNVEDAFRQLHEQTKREHYYEKIKNNG